MRITEAQLQQIYDKNHVDADSFSTNNDADAEPASEPAGAAGEEPAGVPAGAADEELEGAPADAASEEPAAEPVAPAAAPVAPAGTLAGRPARPPQRQANLMDFLRRT